MILTVDIGNTHQSFQLFENKETLLKGDLASLKSSLQEKGLTQNSLTTVVSSVNDKFLNQLQQNYIKPKDFLQDGYFLDMPVHYSATIGEDRLIAAYYLFKQAKKPCVMIDSGSFTTVDYITEKGFMGGHILPGIEQIKQSYESGDNLKGFQFSQDPKLSTPPPRDTHAAIEQGILLTYLAPLERLISSYSADAIFCTGGNGQFIFNHLQEQNLSSTLKLQTDVVHEALLFLAQRIKQ